MIATTSRRSPRHAALASTIITKQQETASLLAEPMLGIPEVATSMGTNVGTVYTWVRKGYLRTFRTGPRGYHRIPLSSLAKLKGLV